jgi:hypothetical protein
VVDWNDDGYPDLITGDRNGYVNFFRRLPSGGLTGEPHVECAGAPIDPGYNSAPAVVDLNGDGRLDLVLGDQGAGTGTLPSLRLYLNQSGSGAPVFTSYSYVQCGGSSISLYRNMPRLVDYDGDGDYDLAAGTCIPALLYYYENTGTPYSYSFSGPDTVYHLADPIQGAGGVRQFLADVDDDTIHDVFVSDYWGMVDLYLSNFTGTGEGAAEPLEGFGLSLAGIPTTGLFSVGITAPAGLPVDLGVYDASGRLVASEHGCRQGTVQLDLTGSPPGLYVVAATCQDAVRTAKLVRTW